LVGISVRPKQETELHEKASNPQGKLSLPSESLVKGEFARDSSRFSRLLNYDHEER
jgi:hypothetical protein